MLAWFANVSAYKALILEREIPFTTTWCLNYAVLDRTVRWLGAAEQIFATPGVQCGSRIDPALQPSSYAVDIGREICAAAQARGYRGLAGLDMGVDASGRLVLLRPEFSHGLEHVLNSTKWRNGGPNGGQPNLQF